MEKDRLLSWDLLQMSLHWENYDIIIEMIHATEELEVRREMISQLAYQNPYLSARAVMTMSYDTEEEKEEERNCLLKIIHSRLSHVSNELSRRLLLLSLLELEENEDFRSTDKGSVDLTNTKTIKYFIDRLNLKQQLAFIRFMAEYQEGVHVKSVVKIVLSRCSVPSKESDISAVIDTAKVLLENRKPGCAYKLLQFVGVRQDFSQVLNKSEQELTDIIMGKAPFLTADETEFLYNIKYGLRAETVNEISIWTAIFQEKTKLVDTPITNLIMRYVKSGMLSDEVLVPILELKGIPKEEQLKGIENRKYLNSVLSPRYKGSIYKEPFYSLMGNEKKILNLLEDGSFENYYAFSEDKRVSRDTNSKEDLTEEYAYFNQCVQNFSSARVLVRVYFNTPLKYVVNFEYLIKTLYECYGYDETDIRYLLRGYILKGRVCQINDSSVSIRAYNFWTLLPCRLSKPKGFVSAEGGKRLPNKGEIIYFKFDYLAEDSDKVNVYLPALSLEEMKELEAQTPEMVD